MPQPLHLGDSDRGTETAAAFEETDSGIEADFHQQFEGFGLQPAALNNDLDGQPQAADRRQVVEQQTAVPIGQGAEVRHHIQFVGAGIGGGLGFGELHGGGDGPKGKAQHRNQPHRPPYRQSLPGNGHPTGGQADPRKAEMAGFITAAQNGPMALVGIQQGVIDQWG